MKNKPSSRIIESARLYSKTLRRRALVLYIAMGIACLLLSVLFYTTWLGFTWVFLALGIFSPFGIWRNFIRPSKKRQQAMSELGINESSFDYFEQQLKDEYTQGNVMLCGASWVKKPDHDNNMILLHGRLKPLSRFRNVYDAAITENWFFFADSAGLLLLSLRDITHVTQRTIPGAWGTGAALRLQLSNGQRISLFFHAHGEMRQVYDMLHQRCPHAQFGR